MTKFPMASSLAGFGRLDEEVRSDMAPCESWRKQEARGEEQPEGLRYAKDVGGRPDRHVYVEVGTGEERLVRRIGRVKKVVAGSKCGPPSCRRAQGPMGACVLPVPAGGGRRRVSDRPEATREEGNKGGALAVAVVNNAGGVRGQSRVMCRSTGVVGGDCGGGGGGGLAS